MSYIIIGKCMGERYGACVEVCPVEAMHYGDHDGAPMMVINPDTCIDCGACLPECPIAAIVDSEDLAPDWAEYNKAAADMWPNASTERAKMQSMTRTNRRGATGTPSTPRS